MVSFPEVVSFFGKLSCLLHHICFLLLVQIGLLVHYNHLDHDALANTLSVGAEKSEDYFVLARLLRGLKRDDEFSSLAS